MNGKINTNGQLSIIRGEKYKPAYCPLYSSESTCGDWCPLFREPYNKTVSISSWNKHGLECRESKKTKEIYLSLCKKELVFKEFIDDRRIK